ncbi:head maturation protease, ClpP-related [Pseudokineococcus marinus]|uniref:ATP-dependent Clp protease proteolytic subunit n=1 Tax=Pseudokineococcus marinus TaxID=351215 RepID=A0A849BF12_9ACTN|nr:head maturation protease, ClpP-related [Pseudokineococcus marinus]NNH21649.1 hypothetical protein [Pseudokineococcus marinus]
MTQLADRFHFLARTGGRDKTPVRATAPSVGGTAAVAVLRLYDPIDSWGEWFGVSAKEFAAVLDELPATTTTVELHVNSPGGEVWEGLAIYNALRQHPARVVVVVDGIAASAASVVAMAGDEVVMSPGAELMVHDAWGLCVGDAAEMERMAADLSRESQNLAGLYARRAGGTADEWRDVMRAETWFTAEEAVASGLADRVDEDGDEEQAATARARFDLSVFAHAGRAAAPAPHTPAPAPAGSGSTPLQEGSRAVAFTDEQLTTMRQELGLGGDADEATIVAALTEALAERAEPSAPSPTASLPEGTSLIETATLDELRADARAGREARTQQITDRNDALVRAAVDDGRIPPVRADHWRAQLAADPGAAEVLASLEPGTVPLAAKGHDGDHDGAGNDPVADVRESPVYRNWRV